MKIIISFIIALLSIILIYMLIPLDTKDLESIVLSDQDINYLASIDLQTDFTVAAKKIIASNKLGNEVSVGKNVPFTAPSSHTINNIYQRDWNYQQKLIYGLDPSIYIESSLFKRDNKYTLLVKYSVNLENNLNFHISMDLKNINYLEVLDVGHIYANGSNYFKEDMLVQSENGYQVHDDRKSMRINYYDGYLLFEILNFNSSVIEINANIFEPYVLPNATLGFNSFNDQKEIQYIPSTSKILFKGN